MSAIGRWQPTPGLTRVELARRLGISRGRDPSVAYKLAGITTTWHLLRMGTTAKR